MSQRIMKHNPAFLSREELVKSFVARKDDLTFVLDHIADNTGASSQHLLIVAPRGMGKTTLVLRAAEAVRTEERFSKIWFPLVYAEETYEVMSAGELWLEGLRHLAEQTQDAEMLAAHRELRREPDEQRLYDRALGRLLEFADQHGKRILLVIENLHMLLDEQISKAEAWKLRKTLQNERRLMLLATATASFEAIENVEQAFFDQFRIYRLEPLDLEGARHVWAHVAGTDVSAEHMRPLQILTGGNPRLLTILATFAGGMSLRALMSDLVRLVDDHTTYFKSHVDSLPAKERKVYVTLADLWQPSTAREVAEQARMSPSEVSALLNRLTQRGAVTTSGEDRRKAYQLAERMYNIYHLLRRSGGDETRVRAVVDFMVGFYDPISMVKVVKPLFTLAEDSGEEMASLVNEAGEPVLTGLIAAMVQPHDVAIPMLQQNLEKINGPKQRTLLLCCLGYCLTNERRNAEAEKVLREALRLSPDEPCVRSSLARILANNPGQAHEAEQLALQAIDLDPSLAAGWNALTQVFHSMPVAELAMRAGTYDAVLRRKNSRAQDLAVAGLWAFYLGARTRQLPLAGVGTRAIGDAWNKGQRSSVLGLLLLQTEIGNEETIPKDFLDQLSTSFDSRVIRAAFNSLWASASRSHHLLAVPHLPVLLVDKSLGVARLPLIGLLIVLNRWEEARNHLQELLPISSSGADTTKPDEETLQQWTRLFVDAAATNHAREALDILVASPLARWLEPVVVALHTYLGQAHRAPQEVSEVARDVVERIRARAAALQAGAREVPIDVTATPPRRLPGETKKRTQRGSARKPAVKSTQ